MTIISRNAVLDTLLQEMYAAATAQWPGLSPEDYFAVVRRVAHAASTPHTPLEDLVRWINQELGGTAKPGSSGDLVSMLA